MKLDELRGSVASLKDEITTLSDKDTLDEAEETRFAAALDEFKVAKADLDKAEARDALVSLVRATKTSTASGVGVPNQINRDDPLGDVSGVRSLDRKELVKRAMQAAEQNGSHLTNKQQKLLEQKIRSRSSAMDGSVVARMLLISESEEYHSAFAKGMSGNPFFTPEEANAAQEMRAANEGTTTAGGFGIPVLIDPTIILTSGAISAPILDICKITPITTNQWKGVSSAGVTWSYYAEAAVVADNTPTLAQPTIPVYRNSGFIPYTIEVGEDYPDFQEEMSEQLAQGYLNLVAVTSMTGTGSSQPTGIFTGMQTGSGAPSHIICTTLGTFGAVDGRAAWKALPERFRANATWVMHVAAENNVRAWSGAGTAATALSDFTVNMTAEGVEILMGHRLMTSDYAPPWTGTTGAASAAVVGDFSHFRLIQRQGMVVELVPHLFDTSTGRPIAERGWFAYARHGMDADTYNAFRLISNT